MVGKEIEGLGRDVFVVGECGDTIVHVSKCHSVTVPGFELVSYKAELITEAEENYKSKLLESAIQQGVVGVPVEVEYIPLTHLEDGTYFKNVGFYLIADDSNNIPQLSN